MCPVNTYSGAGASSCTKCPSGTTSKKGSTGVDACTSPVPDDCKDNNEYCGSWKDNGYCADGNEYYNYMELNCAKTCEFCESCEDKEQYCSTWAGLGFCSSTSEYYAYMIGNCKVSCGVCEKGEEDTCGGGLTRCPDGVCRHIHLC